MAKKTNKTSHVLNLITGGTTEPEAENQASQAAPTPQTSAPDQKVMVVDSGTEEQIAEDIRKQLLLETGDPVSEPAVSSQSAPETAAPKIVISENTVSRASAPKTAVSEVPATSTPASETLAAKKAEDVLQEPKAAKEEEIAYRMVNVMEEILNPETVKAEMEKYGVCLCSRCQADVRALLLTRLPAKYIVVDNTSVSPLLSYYKNKFRVESSDTYAQSVHGCAGTSAS